MPWARSIVVPVSYAILEVFKTQLLGMFTRRDPPIEIEGTGPEDVRPAKAMNAVIAYDQVQCNYVLGLQTAIQDALKYGMGGFHDGWEEELGWKTIHAKPFLRPLMERLGIPTSKQVWGRLREYQHVEAFDPYSFFPDPRVSLSDIQKGEFCGHRLWRGYLEILANSIENGGNYFNCEQVAKSSPKPQTVRSRNRWQVNQMNLIGSMDELDKGFHALDCFTVTIIPEQWKLGPGTKPEKWRFTWVDDQVIIRAHRADPEHGQFPYSAMESNIDTHVFGNQGSIEMLDGLARFMNWTYNCYDDQTEILTERGFVNFADLSDIDKVATVSPDETRTLSFERPKNRFEYDHDGPMVYVQGSEKYSRLDLAVTPNHRMWTAQSVHTPIFQQIDGNIVRIATTYQMPCEFSLAADLKWDDRIPVTVAPCEGIEDGELVLPTQPPQRYRGDPAKYPEKRIPYADLAELIGWYVSEGSINRGTQLCLKQKKSSEVRKIDALMDRLPFHVCRYVDKKNAVSWTIGDRRLAKWFIEHCGSGSENKKLPAMIFRWGPKLSKLLIDAAIDGDGYRDTKTLAQYHSTSRELAEGIQLLGFRLGWNCRFVPRGKLTSGKSRYDVLINFTRDRHQAGKVKTAPYQGKIYCIENSTHLTVVRRNGKIAICGQSHLQNQIRMLNNRMIYSTLLMEENDIENPDAGMHIRLTSTGDQLLAKGALSIDQMYSQMQITDVTTGMVQSVNQMMDFAMRMSGAADQMMGRTTAEKRTLGEVQRVGQEGSARMGMLAQMMDIQGVRPLALRWASNRQQYTSEEMYVKIAGDLAKEMGADRMKVRPQDLYGNYDYSVKLGGKNDNQGEVLWNAVGIIAQNPEILGMADKDGNVLDLMEFIKEALRSGDIKDVQNYFKPMMANPMAQQNVQVMPDEQLQQQAQAGNVIPINQAA